MRLDRDSENVVSGLTFGVFDVSLCVSCYVSFYASRCVSSAEIDLFAFV
jgi:hypothetical protein